MHHSSAEVFHISLSPHGPLVQMAQLAFDGASRKTRPNLASGDLVYARVCGVVGKYLDQVEVECFTVSPTTGVSDEGLGPLEGGTVVDVGVGFARRLFLGAKKGGIHVLDLLGERVTFEVAVGRNGRVWIGKADIKVLLLVSRVLKEVAVKNLNEKEQKDLVNKLLKTFAPT